MNIYDCTRCNNYHNALLSIARRAEARGFALPHEVTQIAEVKAWRKVHRANFHGTTEPVGALVAA